MNIRKVLFNIGTCAAFASLALTARAQIPFTGISNTNVQDFGSGPQWNVTLALPDGTSIGPGSPITLDLTLTGDVSTLASNANGGYAAGIVVDPEVPPGGEIFGFSYQMLENGTDVGDVLGFDETNPFATPVNDVSTGFGVGPGTSTVTFDQLDITVYNNSQTEDVSQFSVYLNVPAATVPDTSSTLGLVFVGFLAMAGFRYRRLVSIRAS